MDRIASAGQLPALRKRPSQSRSRALVDAVEQACLRILDESGEGSLTVARIAEISGVAVGSIYQYFPNKDAIVALLYERILDQESEELLKVRERLVGVPLKSALRDILANIIRVETRLFKLNKVFHLRYHSALHLGMWRGPYQTTGEFIEATWLPLLQMYEHEVTTEHPALAAYLLGQGLRSVIRSVLEDMPAQLESSALLDSIVAMAIGCLRPSSFD
ncbi:TetR/AcrR family transcriptional regulator [Pseudomonas auratipiscis]|uniref:TetR/AcrR family transcriptional regulator n=1 Tax=Pseudomonas auratipiscis TaxID=3115853 RepID=A0AB35WUA3_9PSED|nr:MULTISPECIES: TetR/AcrR family transcriptional regulator [unclassified Pseudomonas]MEE1868012.1 TetR/AcrR family transcriptional regulator [Pseudomonas sp. 120P]MEE1959117.1 TetR/AcrR family transcriptional regulator [Pseudomonas sp. 119P]